MKHVILQRAWADDRATMGILRIIGSKHDPIFTLENPARATNADSRILPGTYVCVPYASAAHPEAWHVQNVPERTSILIHSGNTEKDTLGCILVGLAAGTISDVPRVNGSRDAMTLLKKLLGTEAFSLTVVEERNFCG